MIRRPPYSPRLDDPPPGRFEEAHPPPSFGRSPFFPKSRYPGATETETEHYVPGDDPLRWDRLQNLPDLPFDCVVNPEGDHVFRSRGGPKAAAGLFVLSLLGATCGMAIRAVAPYVIDARITAVWAFLAVGVFVWAKREKAPLKVAGMLTLLVPLCFVLVHVVALARRGGHEGHVATGIAVAVVVFFVDAFTNHWARVLLATGALPPALRRAWTAQWESRFTPRMVVRKSTRRGTLRAGWAILGYPLGFMPLWWAFANAGRADALTTVPLGMVGFGLVFALRASLVPTPLRPIQSLQRAVYSWFTYGFFGLYGPGVFRSPAGPIPYRIGLLGVVLALLSGTLLPPGDVIAAGVDLEGLGPLAQGSTLALLFLELALFPLLVVGGVVLAAALPVFSALEALTDGTPDERAARQIDFINDTIATSANDTVRRQVFYGYHATAGYPVVVSRTVAEGHERVTGGTAGGKSALAILLRVKQWLRRTGAQRGPVLVVDLKPDLNLFHSVRRSALESGRTFRFFTNEWGYATHVLNPIPELRAAFGLLTRSGPAAQAALNLEHGSGYAKQHFGALARSFLRDLLANPDAESVREIVAAWKRKLPTLRPEERKRAEHSHEVLLNLETIANKPECNITRGPAFDARFDFARAVANDEVLYLALSPKAEGEAVARALGSLAVELFYQAILRWNGARDDKGRRVNPEKRGWAALDEFQLLAGRNFESFLEESRERGLSLLLGCQSVQKLSPELRLAVETCTAVKQYFTARTPQEIKDLTALGGTTMRAVFDLEGGVKLRESDRLSKNILKVMSAEPDLSVLQIETSLDYAMFDGFPILVRTPHCQSKAEHKAARGAAWPTYAGLVVVGEEMSTPRGTNVVPFPVPGVAASMPPSAPAAAGKPLRGTPLAAMFERLVISEHGDGVETPKEEEHGG